MVDIRERGEDIFDGRHKGRRRRKPPAMLFQQTRPSKKDSRERCCTNKLDIKVAITSEFLMVEFIGTTSLAAILSSFPRLYISSGGERKKPNYMSLFYLKIRNHTESRYVDWFRKSKGLILCWITLQQLNYSSFAGPQHVPSSFPPHL